MSKHAGMAAAEPLVPSRRLRSAATAERERLGRELDRLDERAGGLQRELEIIEARRDELREQLSLLARISADPDDSPFASSRRTDTAGHLQPVPPEESPAKATVRGARIRELAVLLLASSPNPRRPIHYQQWYELLRGAGYAIAARDPLAAFLTQITRSPVVRRAGAPGVYALDFEAPALLRQRLRKLEAALAQAPVGVGSAEELASGRERRAEQMRAIRAAERDLEEALRSLGDESRDPAD
jgi:hypothetical protein